MKDNTQRFTGKVAVYDRYRQRYPVSVVLSILRHRCGLESNWTVADIGAGTGMLSEVFLTNGNRVISIEPNDDMRAACNLLASSQLEVVNATAEDTGLPACSVHMVAAGRAFHWFDTQRALKEFRRILKPGGWVALVAAGRAHENTEQAQEFNRILSEHTTDYTYSRSTYRIHDRLNEFFHELHQEQIPGEQAMTWNQFYGMAQSISVSPKPESANYLPFQSALEEYFRIYAREGTLTMQTTCWISVGRW